MNARLSNRGLERGPFRSGHKGLLLDKYVTVKAGERKESYAEPLKEIASAGVSDPAYALAFERWRTLCAGLPGAVLLYGTIKGRMAIGLGRKGTTEIGCTLHSTYGVPTIPGSSIKGALASGLRMNGLANEKEWKDRADFLFGTQDGAGFLRVFDAWWVPEGGKSGLSVDVITAHHSDYYAGGAGAAPSDFDSPVPNHFVTVTGKFLFAAQAPNESWRVFVSKLLKQTLEQKGIGGKRAAGYGRFSVSEGAATK